MAETNTTWKIVALAVFKDTMPQQLVLIVEAIMCSLFSSYALKRYRNFRLPELPHGVLDVSVNRSDPLEIDGHILTNQMLQQQYRTLANALVGGPQNVSVIYDDRLAIKEFQFQIFNLDFTISRGLGTDWGLASSLSIKVTFDISLSYHEFPHAILCESYDVGSHLGISISKVVVGIRKQWWLENRTMRGIQIANSLVD